MAEGANFAVAPYIIDGLWHAQFNELRRGLVYKILNGRVPVLSARAGVSPYLYGRNGGRVLILVNTTIGNLDSVDFYTSVSFLKIERVGKDGKIKPCAFTRAADGLVSVNERFEYMSTETLILT